MMSLRKRGGPAQIEDLVDAQFIDEDERAESQWLLASESDPNSQAPSPNVARDCDELEDLLGSLPATSTDESWHDEVLKIAASMSAPPSPWWRRKNFRWVLGGALGTAAAIGVVVVLFRPAELEVTTQRADAVRNSDAARSSGDVVVGDHLLVTARPRGGPSDLRVYRADSILVAKCPNGQGCSISTHGEYVVDITLTDPVQYQVILVVGTGDAMADLPGGPIDEYLKAARSANARIVIYRPIDVH